MRTHIGHLRRLQEALRLTRVAPLSDKSTIERHLHRLARFPNAERCLAVALAAGGEQIQPVVARRHLQRIALAGQAVRSILVAQAERDAVDGELFGQ